MEIILGAIGDYIYKHLVKWRILKYVLLALIFAFGWGLAYMEWAVRFFR